MSSRAASTDRYRATSCTLGKQHPSRRRVRPSLVLRLAAAIGRRGLALGGRGRRRGGISNRSGASCPSRSSGASSRPRITRGLQVCRGVGREPEPAQILGVVQLAGHLAHIRVQVGLRHARPGIARAHLTEVLVRRDPARAVGNPASSPGRGLDRSEHGGNLILE
jgi:hypothetical protein